MLLSLPSPKDTRKPGARATATTARQNERTINGEERLRSRSGSRSAVSSPRSIADSAVRQQAGSPAGVAAAAAMAAVRRGDRPFYAVAASGASRRSGDSPEEVGLSWVCRRPGCF